MFKAEGVTVHAADAFQFLKSTNAIWDLVFLDPPYDTDLLARTLDLLPAHLSDQALVYCETGKPFSAPTGFCLIKSSRMGANHMSLLRYSPAA